MVYNIPGTFTCVISIFNLIIIHIFHKKTLQFRKVKGSVKGYTDKKSQALILSVSVYKAKIFPGVGKLPGLANSI